jgi:hypothetical protein
VGASLGLVFLDGTTGAPSRALDIADSAMFEVKRRGGGVQLATFPQMSASQGAA